MNAKMTKIVDWFKKPIAMSEICQSKISGITFDVVLSKMFMGYTYALLGAKDADNRWMPMFPPMIGYFADNINVFVAIKLPSGHEAIMDDEDLMSQYGINTIYFDDGPNVAFVALTLPNDFSINDVFNQTVDAQELIAKIYRIDTSPGIMYTFY